MEGIEFRVDFAGCCAAGKQVLYQMVVEDRIDVAEFWNHAQGCDVCLAYMNAQLRPLAKGAIGLIPKLLPKLSKLARS